MMDAEPFEVYEARMQALVDWFLLQQPPSEVRRIVALFRLEPLEARAGKMLPTLQQSEGGLRDDEKLTRSATAGQP